MFTGGTERDQWHEMGYDIFQYMLKETEFMNIYGESTQTFTRIIESL